MEKTVKQNKSRMNGSEELAQALMRCAGTGIYIIQDGRFQYVNSLFQELTGYTEQELLGVYPLDLVHPADREIVREKAIESLKGGRSLPYEYRFIKKDGGAIWVLERLSSTEYGGKRSAVGSFMDITEHKQAEETLKESEGRFRTLFEATADGILIADVETRQFQYANPALCRMLGYTEEELRTMDVSAIHPKEDLQHVVAEFEAQARGDKTLAPDIPCLRKDGTIVYSDINTASITVDGRKCNVGFFRDITERRRAEESLIESESRLKLAIEALESGIWELNVKTGKAWRSLRHDQIFGYTTLLPEWTYQMFLDHVIPEDRSEVDGKYGYALSTKTEWDFECRIRRVDKTVRWIWAHGNPSEYDDKNEVVMITGIVRDITERKQSEETLAKSEERFRTIMDETHDDYYEVDLAGNYTFANDAWCRSVGYSLEELLGINYRVTTTSDEIEKVYKAFNQIYLTGQPNKALKLKYARKDGGTGLAELAAFPMRNDKGEIIGFRGISHDVTERLRMEEALRQSEERYRTILAEIEEGYYEVDLAGNIKFVNKAACRQFGYAEEELIGTNYRAYVLKEDIKGVYKAWNKVYRTGEPLKSYPFATVRKDGTQMFVENSVSPLRDKEGKIVGFRAVSRDVTEHKQYEQKIAEMATHDSLTGLPNRTLLSDRLTMGLALSRRSGNRLAVLMLDLDKFKTINDTMGHGVGDQLLKAVAERLISVTRKSDTIARIGGDEFVLVLPQVCQPANASRLAQRILDVFREPLVFDGHQLNITTSIGIAVYPEDGKDIEILLKNADTAMYQAKEQGRDMYRFYAAAATKTGTKAQKSV